MTWDRSKAPPGSDRDVEDDRGQEHGGGLFSGPDRLLRMAQAHRHRQRVMRKKAEGGADKGDAAKVSQPGEAAEQEADAVSVHVADSLHGGDKDGANDKHEKAAPEEIEAHDAKHGGDKAAQAGDAKEAAHGGAPNVHEAAPAIGAKLQSGAVSLAKKGTATTPPAKNDPAKVAQQQKTQKDKEKNPGPAQQFPVPHSPLSPDERAKLEEKKEARTITREELARLDWDRRFGNRRDRGVDRFWAMSASCSRPASRARGTGRPSRRPTSSPARCPRVLTGSRWRGTTSSTR